MRLTFKPEELEKYSSLHRLWQGIPSIEVTEKGRIFSVFYSGGITEAIGNYVVLLISDDNAETFSEPVAVAYWEDHRCFDSELWIDPRGRLWWTWSTFPDEALYAAVCDDPDAETLSWSEPFIIGQDVMMNKPTVTKDGRWLFPVAEWRLERRFVFDPKRDYTEEGGSFVYESTDEGKTFTRLGSPDVKERFFDEHILLELSDGTIRNFVRTKYGIGAADSKDGGRTWGEDFDSGYGGPNSRFHVRRLKSGRVLLINHWNFQDRNNLFAMLSEDDGKTFPYKMILDGRDNVSYPDAKELSDGRIYLTYDRERGACYHGETMEESMREAREILVSCITEEDIIAGKLVSESSFLKKTVSKLGAYIGGDAIVDEREAAKK